jgi:hypothetical protein
VPPRRACSQKGTLRPILRVNQASSSKRFILDGHPGAVVLSGASQSFFKIEK